jgi:hypothetical protein
LSYEYQRLIELEELAAPPLRCATCGQPLVQVTRRHLACEHWHHGPIYLHPAPEEEIAASFARLRDWQERERLFA